MELFLICSIWYLVGILTLLISFTIAFVIRKVFGLKFVVKHLENKKNLAIFILVAATLGPLAISFAVLAIIVLWIFSASSAGI